jgi:hypothetical protein
MKFVTEFILSQRNPVQTLPPYLFKAHFNNIFLSMRFIEFPPPPPDFPNILCVFRLSSAGLRDVPFFHSVWTGSEANPTSYLINTGGSFTRATAAGERSALLISI